MLKFPNPMVILLLLLFGVNSLLAQQNLFNPISVGVLNETQQVRYNKVINAPYTLNPQMIQVQSLVGSQVLGNVKIILPSVNCQDLVFKPKTVKYTSENDYYWYGVIESNDNLPCETGSLTLMARNGEKFGSVTLDGSFFEYKDITGGKQVLIKHNKEFFTAGCGNKPLPEDQPWTPPPYPTAPLVCPGSPTTDTPGQIDVLVLYTPAAAAKEPNMYNKASLAIQHANQAFLNSSLNSFNTRLNLVWVLPFAFTETPSDVKGDVIRISGNTTAQNLRNAYKADLVIVFTGVNYGNVAGIVPDIGPINNLAYAIVDVNYVLSAGYTFAHEVGHLFGARHHDDPNGTIEHGMIFQTGFLSLKDNYTIMAGSANETCVIQHFSNPYVSYKNSSTGTVAYRNNAQKIFSTSYALSNFRYSLAGVYAPFVVEIIAPAEMYMCNTYTSQIQAKLTCGVAPFSYEWRTSLNGILFGAVLGTSYNYDLLPPCFVPTSNRFPVQLFVQLKVTDGNGFITTTEVPILISDLPLSKLNNGTKKNATIFSEKNVLVQNIYPNPSKDGINIVVNTSAREIVSIDIIDMLGKKYEVISEKEIQGEYKHHINPNLSNGLYQLRCITQSGKSEIYSIFINK